MRARNVATNVRTPRAISREVLAFCAEIETQEQPEFVNVDATPRSEVNQCFVNVADAAARGGGEVQHGWMVLEWPGVLLEAQFHAIWRRPDGSLVDVTPNDERRILFLPDRTRVYRGRRTPSVQRPLSGAPQVLRFIQACKELHEYEADRWVEDEGGIVLDTDYERLVYCHLEVAKVLSQVQLYEMLGLPLR